MVLAIALNLALLSSESSTMTAHSPYNSSTQPARWRTSVEENSSSCQESCNLIDSKTKKSENGQCAHVQDKIVPLSGSPYFMCIVAKSQLQKPFQLVIPRNFYKYLPNASVPAVLSCQNQSWKMTYSGHLCLKRLCRGFKWFAIDNGLKLGDGCVYELMDGENLEFRVQILRGDIPSRFANGASGQSSDFPLMID